MNDANTTDCELHEHLSALESLVPEEGKSFLFEAGTFPVIPHHIGTPNIDVRKTYHFIDDSCRVDVLNFLASRKTYRYWGLAILATVFRPDLGKVTLELTNPRTHIKSIVFGYSGTTPRGVFTYLTKPHSFEYRPEELSEHPWMYHQIPEQGFPDFLLTFSSSGTHGRWEDRDLLQGFGSDDASVMLANLLLNFGRNENRQLAVRLETIFSPAYRGVSRLSSEVRLHLPGSESWPH